MSPASVTASLSSTSAASAVSSSTPTTPSVPNRSPTKNQNFFLLFFRLNLEKIQQSAILNFFLVKRLIKFCSVTVPLTSTNSHVCSEMTWLGFFLSSIDMPKLPFSMSGLRLVPTSLYLRRKRAGIKPTTTAL